MSSRPVGGSGSAAVLTATCLGLMLSMFNSTIVSVTIPEIGGSFGASSSQLQWISSLYTLVYAALLLPGGALGNRLGRRTAFLAGVLGLALGCLVCAAAPSYPVLLVGRVVQAVGAAVMLPQTLSILVHEYADPAARARAVGIWAGGAAIGLAAGPVLGGVIVTVTTWRAGFVLSLVLAVVTLALGWVAVPSARHGRPDDTVPVDLVGAVLSVVGLTALVYGLIESSTRGWGSSVIWAALAVFVVATAGFVLVQAWIAQRRRQPLMPLSLWRSGGFVAANLTGLAYFVSFFAILFFYSLDLQVTRQQSPLVAGLSFLPLTLLVAVLGPVAGRLTARFGSGPVMIWGLALSALGCLLLALVPGHAPLADVEWRLAVVGIGAGMTSSPASNAAVSSVPAAHSSTASAVYNTFRQIGSTLGVAAIGAVIGPTDAPGFADGLARGMWVVTAVLVVSALVCAALVRPGRR